MNSNNFVTVDRFLNKPFCIGVILFLICRNSLSFAIAMDTLGMQEIIADLDSSDIFEIQNKGTHF